MARVAMPKFFREIISLLFIGCRIIRDAEYLENLRYKNRNNHLYQQLINLLLTLAHMIFM